MVQAKSKLAYNLQGLAPYERLKYIRKKLLGLNQDEFCSDGSISLNTLKQIERGAIRISEKMNIKLLCRLHVFGIRCNDDIFSDKSKSISIDIDSRVKENSFALSNDIDRFNDKVKKLKAIKIIESTYTPFIKQGSIIFVDTNLEVNITSLDKTLCLVEGSETKIFFLTYTDNKVIAKFNDLEMDLSIDSFKMCKVFPIDVIFYG